MKNILKFILVLSALVIASNANADEVVTFKISDGIDDNYIQYRVSLQKQMPLMHQSVS